MLFGDRLDFAIEAELEAKSSLPGMWGRMCVWCSGVMLGNIDEQSCALYPAYVSFRGLPSNIDRLWSDKLEGLDDMATWNFFDGLLYGFHGDIELPDSRTAWEIRRDHTFWSAHDFLTNWGEQFDFCKAFVVCPPEGPIHILARELPGNPVRSMKVSRAGFITSIDAFVRWFEEHSHHLNRGVP